MNSKFIVEFKKKSKINTKKKKLFNRYEIKPKKIYFISHIASEPNMLKLRLKQRVFERKANATGTLATRRQERLLHAANRRSHKQQQNHIMISSSMYFIC